MHVSTAEQRASCVPKVRLNVCLFVTNGREVQTSEKYKYKCLALAKLISDLMYLTLSFLYVILCRHSLRFIELLHFCSQPLIVRDILFPLRFSPYQSTAKLSNSFGHGFKPYGEITTNIMVT